MRLFLFSLFFVFLNVNAQTSREGVEVHKSRLLLLPASTVERSAGQQYGQLMRTAAQKGLLNNDAQQVERLRRIARELIPHATRFNTNAEKWRWEVNLITSKTVNAFCMPGGKIAFFSGIIDQLQLTDDEVATIMGHEIGHALLEHGRARMSEEVLKNVGISVAAAVFNLGQVSAELLAQGANLAVSLPYARRHETDADLVGMELAARAGHDPRAAVAVWQKMSKLGQAAGKGQPPQFLSTHPSHESRIKEIEANLPKVMPLYRKKATP
ncbi:MAG: M48 family peptidase [Betaproteobacteria bacterium]|nr:M48 family peptidase [Betaproteobacteria bacterium]